MSLRKVLRNSNEIFGILDNSKYKLNICMNL